MDGSGTGVDHMINVNVIILRDNALWLCVAVVVVVDRNLIITCFPAPSSLEWEQLVGERRPSLQHSN